MSNLPLPADYLPFLSGLKTHIREAQVRAALAVNSGLVVLYWHIGREVLTRQHHQGWGAKVIDQLAHDLRREFPAMTGFSSRNIKYMRTFAKAWPDASIVQQVVAQIPWGHNVRLLDYVKDPAERAWYVYQTIEFALVGSQYHLAVGGQDYYLDLLFYHLRLRCFVVIDLKMGEFKPEDSGKMNFYLAAVDDLLRHPADQPTIGLILCKTHNRVVSEYALRGLSQPIGVAGWHLTQALPPELRLNLPTTEELEAALGSMLRPQPQP